ncbi:aromatic prenyltransferase [Fusarium austroafricanum]|uniref:Aromatic prenyltransferase n=1 Tax=Fusarium austroafricanum TaxID=2364996 RepID=A0A8H4KG24_9HYPO|nr:aromatic prenyltransferase [Fusarium austroafricanum]
MSSALLTVWRSVMAKLKTISLDPLYALPSTGSSRDEVLYLPAWHRVDSDCQGALGSNGRFWWERHGYALAILLHKSSYSYSAQVTILEFFARFLAPWLGPVDERGVERWKSFMTDDHNPLELSWDWSTARKPPTIRLSLEPIGEHAGTAQDLCNMHASNDFVKALLGDYPGHNMEWFHHFNNFFNEGVEIPTDMGHASKIFWAFNLDANDLAGKVYFTPRYRAMASGKTNFQIISEAIEAAPTSSREKLSALYMFQEYVGQQKKSPLEVEALAIDLVDPSQSRLKIYFRSRQTSFQSVRDIMTLDGRLINEKTAKHAEKGLSNLRRLWDSIFDQQGVPDESPLPSSNHETAGILYYVDFHLGGQMPKVKIYLPVRHYAKNDWQVMQAVSSYMSSTLEGLHGTTYLEENDAPLAFCEAMSDIL